MTEEKKKEALLRVDATVNKLRAYAVGLVISGTVLVIFATATAISYHLYYIRRNAGQLGTGIGRVYLCLSMGIFLVTGILIGGIVAYAFYNRSTPLKEVRPLAVEVNAESALLQSGSDGSDKSLSVSGEHDENCFSCMPNSREDQIPGRSLSVLERSSEFTRKENTHRSMVQEDIDLSSAASNNSIPRFHSDGSVKPGADRQEFGAFADYAIFALSRTDISEAQLKRVEARKYKEVLPTSMKKEKVRAFKPTANSRFEVVTYSPRDGYPHLKRDLHIIRKVRFPWRWRVNNGEVAMIETPSGMTSRNPADFVDANIFYNVDVPITYCNLIKLMFSYQAISSGDTERLFIRYLRFYYGMLWELADRVSNDQQQDPGLTKFEIKQTFYYDPVGARFAADIAQNYANFHVFMRDYVRTEDTKELFGFLESVREHTPKSFSMPSDMRAGYLYEAMCAIYGLSCRRNSSLFKDLHPSVLQVFHYMFFFQEPLRKALITNAIVEETFLEGAGTSFLCEQIYYLKNSIKGILSVYDAETNRDTFDAAIRDMYFASEENKHILAAMSLSSSGRKLSLTSALEGIDDYKMRLRDFKRLKSLAVNPSSCFSLDTGIGQDGYSDVFCSVPYAIVSTIEDLEKEERANVIFDPCDGVREMDSSGLLRIYMDMMQLVDSYFMECIWSSRNGMMGHGFYQSTMANKAVGIYALPLREEFVAIRTVIPDDHEEKSTSLTETGDRNVNRLHSEKADSAVCSNEVATRSSIMDLEKGGAIAIAERKLPQRENSEVLAFSFSKQSPSRSISKVSISGIAPVSAGVSERTT